MVNYHMASSHNGNPGWCAHRMGIIIIQANTAGCQAVQVGSFNKGTLVTNVM